MSSGNQTGMKGMKGMDSSRLQELTGRIIACCHEVSNELGIGFVESVYRNALVVALRGAGLNALAEVGMPVFFRGQEVGDFRLDILVEQTVILELKACKALNDEHSSQCLNYLRASGLAVALLINFGTPRVAIRRFENRFRPSPSSPSSLSKKNTSHER